GVVWNIMQTCWLLCFANFMIAVHCILWLVIWCASRPRISRPSRRTRSSSVLIIVVLAVLLLPLTCLKCRADFWSVTVLVMIPLYPRRHCHRHGRAAVWKPDAHFPPVETNNVIISIR
ncbi:hypothetical protein PENTCL1PPCAC_4677, partial [Pristionchus entomophagus]